MMSFIEMLTGLELRVDRLIGSEFGRKITSEYVKMDLFLNNIEVTPGNSIQFQDCNGLDQHDKNNKVHVKLSRIKEAYPIIEKLFKNVKQMIKLTQFTFHSERTFYSPEYILCVSGSSVFSLHENRYVGIESEKTIPELTEGKEVSEKGIKAKGFGIDGMLTILNETKSSYDTTLPNQRIITNAFFNLCSTVKFVFSGERVYYDFDGPELESAKKTFNGYLTSFGNIIQSAGQRPKPQP